MTHALTVENVSKRFWIGERREGGARHAVEKAIRNPLSLFENTQRKEFWALKDLNFNVELGQKLAIIGRNGAGKSTLLKLISRITLPTLGNITLNGRVGSLLEVGTGFHPELTGRENIFLNGALLGMRRAEIAQNFDAIVEFAEIAEFLDTPVKRYSSGMYVRLAFAVAAHLQSEILIVDEVLAVGDSRFQKKCIEKMNEVGRAGRTVLFVSHNLALVQSVCTHGLLLDHGRQIAFGDIESVLGSYQKSLGNAGASADGWTTLDMQRGQGANILTRVKISFASKKPQATPGDDVMLDVEAKLPANMRQEINLLLRVTTDLGATLFTLSSLFQYGPTNAKGENFHASCRFTLPNLREGSYAISLELYSRDTLIDDVPGALTLEVAGTPTGHDYLIPAHHGPLVVPAKWSL